MTVRKYYLDGEFEDAIKILEAGLRDKRAFKHDDSVFIYKHLGVMYAAKYETREKGKYFMHQLLMTEPTAKIMDMYASDMIYMIFKNIQDEFESTRGRLVRAETHLRENALPEPKPITNAEPAKVSPSSHGKGWVWLGATTAVVAAGMGAYFMLSDEPKTVTQNSSFE
ncbi:MAG: hypothetical protein M3Y08_18105 [Fibrobacterota bacterium]|nr:hypothetical protein [Fibrobacterota bacterium]